MNVVELIHNSYVHRRRSRVLIGLLAPMIPPHARVLDVGCGDGLVSRLLVEARPDLRIQGIDNQVRKLPFIPVLQFDGYVLPFPESSFDVVMMVDVLHHTTNQFTLLHEGKRVTKKAIVLKDHLCHSCFSNVILRFMDRVGNRRHDVPLPHVYWPASKWFDTFARLELRITAWREDLNLYPRGFNWLFGRNLHFIAGLEK